MFQLNLNKNEKYILACSFGPDSMCLFDLLLNQGYDFVVAHVNYHLRYEEPSEILKLKELCDVHNIKLFIKDFYMPKNVNEEGWAREVRYNWFNDLSEEINIKNVLIAHNEDDKIETYLIQEKRNGIVAYYGLKNESHYKGVKIIRPLLNIGKKSLKEYCDHNRIPYGIDLSNYDTKFLRNKLRHETVSKLNEVERKELINLIDLRNNNLKTEREKFLGLFYKKSLIMCKLLKLNNENIHKCVVFYLENKGFNYPISKGYMNELVKIFKTKKSWHKIDNDYILSLENGYFGIYKIVDNPSSKIVVNHESEYCKKIENNQYKIICGPNTNSRVKINGGTKKIGRCFIDWKVPYIYRKVWPVIVDENNEVVYIPHYQKDYKENESSILKFNLNDLFE